MSTGEFIFLLAGMYDNIAPSVTEPKGNAIARLTQEAHARAVARAKKG